MSAAYFSRLNVPTGCHPEGSGTGVHGFSLPRFEHEIFDEIIYPETEDNGHPYNRQGIDDRNRFEPGNSDGDKKCYRDHVKEGYGKKRHARE